MMMCGGHTQARVPDDDEKAMVAALKAEAEAQLGSQYTEFEAVALTSQVVAGTNFQVKIRTNTGFVHIKIYRPLPHTGQPPQIS